VPGSPAQSGRAGGRGAAEPPRVDTVSHGACALGDIPAAELNRVRGLGIWCQWGYVRGRCGVARGRRLEAARERHPAQKLEQESEQELERMVRAVADGGNGVDEGVRVQV
jgi:hypothetical protein